MQAYDVVIVGAGMVGLSLAVSLENSGLKIAIIDSQSGDRPLTESPELRVSAINLATQKILQNLDVWEAIAQHRLQPYENMEVWEKDSFANIQFSHQQVHQAQLGYIIENQLIRQQLWNKAEQSRNIDLFAPHSIDKLVVGQRECFISLADDTMLTARLIVGADGANSYVRKQADMPLTFWDYDHIAIVTSVRTQIDHGNTARQVFTPEGPLAFLPLYESNLCSIVWSQEVAKAEHLMAMEDEEFAKVLTATFDGKLGRCEVVGKRVSYPLKMRYCRSWVKERVALIGDAAHTIHPLAGQGANLGFLDAMALSQEIQRLHNDEKDIGLAKNLRPYERWRKTEAVKMIATMEGFKRLFSGDAPIKKLLRDVGLAGVNQIPFAKQHIIQQAMGLSGELPELAK